MVCSELQVLEGVQAAPETPEWEETPLPQEKWFGLPVRVGNNWHYISGAAGQSCLPPLKTNQPKQL